MADRPEPPASWAELPFFADDRWEALWQKLEALPDWQPKPEYIFRALELTQLDEVRVIILGQDPYETKGRATGLAFELGEGHESSQSLKGIRAELRRDLGSDELAFPNFTDWATQGVLLLNTALTVQVGKAGSHSGLGWSPLVNQILHELYKSQTVVFLLWGKHAIQTALDAGLKVEEDPRVFACGHPRGGRPPVICGERKRPFKNSKHFSQANTWLEEKVQKPVKWGNL